MSVALDDEVVLRKVIGDRATSLAESQGGSLSWEQVSALPMPDGSRRRIATTGGIWNPAELTATLSIMMSQDGPYLDRTPDDGLIHYAYERADGGRNLKLVRAFELKLPLLLLTKLDVGQYLPTYPVFVVGNNPIAREVTVAVDAPCA